MASVAMASAVVVRWVDKAGVAGALWPKECWMRRRLTPASTRCVAHEWRSVCTDARLWMPLALRAARKASWTLWRGMGVEAVAIPQPAPARRREQPHRMAVGGPIRAEEYEGRLGQRPIAVLGPFATPHVDKHAGTLNIGHLEVGAFLQAQPTGIDGTQTGAVARQPDTLEDSAHFLHTQDDRELLLPWGTDKGEGRPFPFEGRLVEELDAAEGNGTGRAGVVFDVLDIQERVPELFLSHLGRRLVVMFGQLAHGPDIHLLGPLRQTAELKVFDHPLTQWGHGDTSCMCEWIV